MVSTAIILCGGLSTRMGALTVDTPKALLAVNGKPIIWYTMKFLIQHGIKKFIFPLGYRGEQIKSYILEHFDEHDRSLIFKNTGKNTNIHIRIQNVISEINDRENFVLLNSDTIFSFNLKAMMKQHVDANNELTLTTVPITSPWGIVVNDDNGLLRFERELKIKSLRLYDEMSEGKFSDGQVYSGLCALNSTALQQFDWLDCYDFETDLFNECIARETAASFQINGFWYPIDTPKHLTTINEKIQIALKTEGNNRFKSITDGDFDEEI